ncbi:MAG: R3H domain-containing nucleic acid-binding protein [Chloroflexota bacterium]|nr:R3H domain-containing nucleic acid-binding protein [Chloroflexota bacterium]
MEIGLKELGVSREQVGVVVERDAKAGFLGIGGQEATVTLSVLDTPGDGKSQKNAGSRGQRQRNGDSGGASSGQKRKNGDEGAEKQASSRDQSDPPRDIKGVPESEEIPIPGSPQELPLQPAGDYEDEVDQAGSTLRDVLTLLGFTGTEITMSESSDEDNDRGRRDVTLEVDTTDDESAENIGVLIGKRGDTLSSLQYLLNTIVGRGKRGSPMFSVDIEGYRRRHRERLIDLAEEVANDVSESGDIIELKPMSAADRRIIHVTLQERSDVVTQSIGKGRDRRIEVLPADEESEFEDDVAGDEDD